jgi:hypothetical protein
MTAWQSRRAATALPDVAAVAPAPLSGAWQGPTRRHEMYRFPLTADAVEFGEIELPVPITAGDIRNLRRFAEYLAVAVSDEEAP